MEIDDFTLIVPEDARAAKDEDEVARFTPEDANYLSRRFVAHDTRSIPLFLKMGVPEPIHNIRLLERDLAITKDVIDEMFGNKDMIPDADMLRLAKRLASIAVSSPDGLDMWGADKGAMIANEYVKRWIGEHYDIPNINVLKCLKETKFTASQRVILMSSEDGSNTVDVLATYVITKPFHVCRCKISPTFLEYSHHLWQCVEVLSLEECVETTKALMRVANGMSHLLALAQKFQDMIEWVMERAKSMQNITYSIPVNNLLKIASFVQMGSAQEELAKYRTWEALVNRSMETHLREQASEMSD